MIGKSLGLDALNSHGEVRVRSTFQMVNHPRIFALGDIADTGEQKSARKTRKHCQIVANNIATILRKGHEVDVSNGLLYRPVSFFFPVLLPYPGCIEVLPLSNGKVRGYVLQVWPSTEPTDSVAGLHGWVFSEASHVAIRSPERLPLKIYIWVL